MSVHGRSWQHLDRALIKQEPLIGVLTDKENSPDALAKRLLNYGYTGYRMYVGEDLEGENEKMRRMELAEAAETSFHPLNCLILEKVSHRNIPFGIPDQQFNGLEGRPNMITKMPARLCSLHALELEEKSTFWDIGFCTGSISIEAKLRFPQLDIHAFEIRPECREIMEENQRVLGAPGIKSYIGDFFDQELTSLPKPDAVFVGGHGGRLPEILQKINEHLKPGGVVVMNAVQEDSIQRFSETSRNLGWKLEEVLNLQVNTHNALSILKAVKEK